MIDTMAGHRAYRAGVLVEQVRETLRERDQRDLKAGDGAPGVDIEPGDLELGGPVWQLLVNVQTALIIGLWTQEWGYVAEALVRLEQTTGVEVDDPQMKEARGE